MAARLAIWTLFLLIVTKLLEYLTFHGSPLRPFEVYAVIILVAVAAVGVHIRSAGLPRIDRLELAFFGIGLALLSLLVASPGGHGEYWLKTSLWPVANMVMAGCLFYFVRVMALGDTVRSAALAALALQLGAVIVDLWFPGTFAEWAPRPAGFPQNANNGALLICLLTALLLPTQTGRAPSRVLLYVLAVSAPLLLATLSKSGFLFYLAVMTGLFVSMTASQWPERRAVVLPAGTFALMVAMLIVSPDMRRPDTTAIWHSRIGIAAADVVGAAEAGQTDTDASMKANDDTSLQRRNAFRFFWQQSADHPLLGRGTGYTFQFTRGPHNTFLLLLAENGLFAPILYAAGLLLLGFIAIRRRSPVLFVLTAIAVMNGTLSHTQIVEPWFAVFGIVALASSAVRDDAAERGHSCRSHGTGCAGLTE